MTQSHPQSEQIRMHAYQLYQARGCQHGHAMNDWLQAEYELLRLPTSKIVELKPSRSRKNRIQASALVALVQMAALLGTNAMSRVQD